MAAPTGSAHVLGVVPQDPLLAGVRAVQARRALGSAADEATGLGNMLGTTSNAPNRYLLPESAGVSPLNRIGYRMADAPTPPMLGSRQTGIDRAWALERELIERSGRGSSPWTTAEITRIKAGDSYTDLGYTGHHLDRVKDAPAWSGDPRNIVFLKHNGVQILDTG